jgi:hypothetical protein
MKKVPLRNGIHSAIYCMANPNGNAKEKMWG